MEDADYTIDTKTGELVFNNGIKIISRRFYNYPEKVTKETKSIVFPDSVKEINSNAFGHMEKLEKVIFPEGLERIGEEAFFSCKKLKEVIFPKSLRSIESKAFAECSALTHIVISRTTSSLEIKDEDYLEIEDEAFADCVRLSNVEMKEGAFETTILYDQVFENTAFLKELRKKDPLVILENEVIDGKECQGDLVLPAHVKGIGAGAFKFNHKITSVVCPDNMEYLNDSAFEGCLSLKKVVLPENIISIHGSSFNGCTSLEEIVLPQKKEIRYIGEYAFKGTPWLKKQQADGCPVIRNGWLIDGSACKGEVHISGVKKIARSAFKNNHEITQATIEEGCIDIFPKAFMDCPALKEVTLPSKMEGIGFSAFENCYQLSKINIPEGIEHISTDLFYNCRSLKEINIPKSLKEIHRRAFFNCVKLKNLVISPRVKVAEDYHKTDKEIAKTGRIVTAETEKGCRKSYHNEEEVCIFVKEEKYNYQKDIVVAIIPEGVKVIGYRAFFDCDNLKKVVLPASLEVIEWDAFYECEKLEEIVLPEQLKYIGERAFAKCRKLKNIVLPPKFKMPRKKSFLWVWTEASGSSTKPKRDWV